jgi:dihydroorotase
MNISMRIILRQSSNLGDVEITDGIITALGSSTAQADEEIDCRNALIWPGLIDSHVHFRTPGQEYKEDWTTGSLAALAGGVTSVVDMPNTLPTVTGQDIATAKRGIIDTQTAIEYTLPITATEDTVEDCIAAQADFIKLYLGASTGNIVLYKQDCIEKIFANTTGLLLLHSEDEDIIRENEQTYKNQTEPAIHSAVRGREAAISATQNAIQLAKQYNRTIYLCHVSTVEEIELIKQARQEGVKIYLEVTPHHLYLNEFSYQQLGMLAKVNPPLRTPADNQALWKAVADGTVDVISSDHAPHTLKEKQTSYWQAPAGLPGIEFMFPLLLTAVNDGIISLDDIKRCCIDNPASIFGFAKTLAIGQPADLVAFDAKTSWIVEKTDVRSKCGWTPYAGFHMTGKIQFAISKKHYYTYGTTLEQGL